MNKEEYKMELIEKDKIYELDEVAGGLSIYDNLEDIDPDDIPPVSPAINLDAKLQQGDYKRSKS